MKKIYLFVVMCCTVLLTVAQPANDNCNTATTINVSSGSGFALQATGTVGATASTQTSGDATGKDDDVWFQFTTNGTNNYATVAISDSAFDTGFGNPVFELWDACTDATYINWFPFANKATLGNLLPNKTYRLRVYTYGTSSRYTTFKLTVNLAAAPPSNDSYFNATTIALNAGTSCSAAVVGATTVGATEESGPGACGGASTHNEVWYKFVATNTNVVLQLTNVVLVSGSNATMVMDAFEGSNTGTPKLCSNTGTLNFDGSTSQATLTLGSTYYVRIYNQDAASSCNFNICSQVPPFLSYTNCNNAVNIPVSANEYCGSALRLTNVNTDAGTNLPPCVTSAYNSVWLKFTAPNVITKLQVSIQNYVAAAGSQPIFYIAVYGGSCGALSYLKCGTGNILDMDPLVTGNTYYIRIMTASASTQGSFDVCLRTLPLDPKNAQCITAPTLVATADMSANYFTSTTYSLPVANATACYGGIAPNAIGWFKFVATATSHYVDIKNVIPLTQNGAGLGYRVSSGSCGSLTPIVCVGAVAYESQVLTGLTIGNTYFIEVMENTYNGGAVSYKIRVVGNAAPVNDESASATTIIQNPTCTTIDGTFRNATLSTNVLPTGTYTQDVWYTFVAAASTANVTFSGGFTAPRIALYNAAGTSIIDGGTDGYAASFTGLVVGTTYKLRVLNLATPTIAPSADFTICVSGIPSVAVADVATTGASCQTVDGPVTSTNSNRWLHITHAGKIVASVFDNPGGAGMGVINARYYINGSGSIRRDVSNIEYLDRNFEITPTTQPLQPVRVRLYFSKTEFDAIVAAASDADGQDVFYFNDLRIAKFSTAGCASTINPSGADMYNVIGWGSLSSTTYYVEIEVPSFSSFFATANTTTVLPVSCNNFSAKKVAGNVELAWSTLNETNSNYFELQRSTDGIAFITIASIPASINSSTVQNYQYVDVTGNTNTTYYYRLKEVDKNGLSQFVCKTVMVKTTDVNNVFGTAYPNPFTNSISIDVLRPISGKVDVQIINSLGQVVLANVISKANTVINIPTQPLKAGVYTVRITTSSGVHFQQITKL